MKRVLLIALVLVLAACGAADDNACRLTLSPEPELQAATESAAGRWTAATGCQVRVAPRGAPVLLVDHVFEMPDGSAAFSDPEGIGAERGGVNDDTGISISRMQLQDLDMAVAHEMGHRLGAKHTATGVMNCNGGELIDEASLMSVCSVAHCTAFVPETPSELDDGGGSR